VSRPPLHWSSRACAALAVVSLWAEAPGETRFWPGTHREFAAIAAAALPEVPAGASLRLVRHGQRVAGDRLEPLIFEAVALGRSRSFVCAAAPDARVLELARDYPGGAAAELAACDGFRWLAWCCPGARWVEVVAGEAEGPALARRLRSACASSGVRLGRRRSAPIPAGPGPGAARIEA
jgi:hypothetical protein